MPAILKRLGSSPRKRKAKREAQRGELEAMGETTDTSPLFTAIKKKIKPRKPDAIVPLTIDIYSYD